MKHEFAHVRDAALEAISLGEASAEQAGKALAPMLTNLSEASAEQIYAALRDWTWQTLEARRRDDDLVGWADLIGVIATRFEDQFQSLSHKLDGFLELLHPSITLSAVQKNDNPLRRKHVSEILRVVFHAGGRLSKQKVMNATKLREANVTRVMGPLIDRGWFHREADGRDVNYRLTERGRETAIRMLAEISELQTADTKGKQEGVTSATAARIDVWGHSPQSVQDETGPRNYVAAVGVHSVLAVPNRDQVSRYALRFADRSRLKDVVS